MAAAAAVVAAAVAAVIDCCERERREGSRGFAWRCQQPPGRSERQQQPVLGLGLGVACACKPWLCPGGLLLVHLI